MEGFARTEKSPAEQLVKQWEQGPTILASTSTFRAQKLAEMGFTDISLATDIPENIETELAQTLNQDSESIRTHYDSDGQNHSEHIAAAKVNEVLKHEEIDPAAIVIAADTTAVIYDKATETQFMGVPKSAEKYEHIETAKADMVRRFKILAEGMQELSEKIAQFKRIQESLGGTAAEIEDALAYHTVGIRRGAIYINTGVAIAFPQAHDQIHRFTEEVKLYASAIAETDGNEQALEKLAELIIATQGPEKTLSISGGIDYADSYVRDILDLHEATFPGQPTADESLYRGFAPRAITTLLTAEAERLTK